MAFSVAGQLTDFLWAVLVGCGLGVLYDVFRLWRLLLCGKGWVFLQDILWWMLFAFLSFYFALVWQGGIVRWYTLAGELAGFWVYHKTLGKAVFFVAEKLLRLLITLLQCILYPFRLCFNFLMVPVHYVCRKEKEILKNLFIFLKESIIIKKEKRLGLFQSAERRGISGDQEKETTKNRFSH